MRAHTRGKWRRNWTYWSMGASVYPDGIVHHWTQEHTAHGPVTIAPVDGHLNADGRYWDGHTQGHCGEHVYISGTDRAAVQLAFDASLAVVIARQDGVCHSKFHAHGGDIDGATVYESAFMRAKRRGEQRDEKMECYKHWGHDWSDPEGRTSQCKNCTSILFTSDWTPITLRVG